MSGKFSHLSSEYQSLFEKLNDGKRTGNQACDMNTICVNRPTWGRNEACGFQMYACERALNATHEDAMQAVNSGLVWR